jgi:hypothetical protein
MATSIRIANCALATCALALLFGSSSATAAPIQRSLYWAYFGTDSESWVEEVLGVDVYMIAQVSSSNGELTGLGDWELVSFEPDTNPFDDFFNYGSWTYSGDAQVAYYSLERLFTVGLWEPDPANAGEINWLAPDHLTLWGIAGTLRSGDRGDEGSPGAAVPEPSAALLFVLGSTITLFRVRRSAATPSR